MRNFVLFVATGAGSGLVPVAPGTAGALVGLGIWVALAWSGMPPLAVPLAALVATGIGVWAAGRAGQLFGNEDDGRITIDEVAGMLLSLAFLPLRPDVAITGFLLFRLFDIWKPFPADRAERLPGGVGVMADDLVAGLYANLAGQLLWRVALPGGVG